MNLFPTILPASQTTTNTSEAKHKRLITKTPRKPPTARVLQLDELQNFKKLYTIQNLANIDDTCIKSFGEGFSFLNRNFHLIIFKLETNISNVPEVTHCIDVSTDLRVKLHLKNVPIPLPERFRQERNTLLTSKAMIVNFTPFLSEMSEEQNKIMDVVNCSEHYERPVFSYDVILFALQLSSTSVQAYKVTRKEMRLPSLSLLRNSTHGEFLCPK